MKLLRIWVPIPEIRILPKRPSDRPNCGRTEEKQEALGFIANAFGWPDEPDRRDEARRHCYGGRIGRLRQKRDPQSLLQSDMLAATDSILSR